jgi:hypothetical protein
MKLNLHKVMILEISTWIILASMCAHAGALEDLPWGPSSNGIQVSLTLIDSKNNDLQVAFRNIGNQDVILNIGFMLANGKVQLPNYIVLSLTDAKGENHVFEFLDMKYLVVAGRIDDYIIPLRVGSTYTLKLRPDQVVRSPNFQRWDTVLLPGKNQLIAQFEGKGAQLVGPDTKGIKFMNFWLGTAESNTLVIER